MKTSNLKLALIGATGLVGRTMLEALEKREVSVAELFPVATQKSRGTSIHYLGREYSVSSLEDNLCSKADMALLSAGARISRKLVPILVKAGVTCIDNSSAFRQDDTVPLVVPEVNPEAIKKGDRIIANPNCSTIQLVIVLAPLHRAFGVQEVVVSTYQSTSGVGQKGKARLQQEMSGDFAGLSPFPHPIFENLVPGIGSLIESAYYSEEWKLVQESRKIMSLPDLVIFPTAVRVPISHCHGEAVHIKFDEKIDPIKAREVLIRSPGIVVSDEPEQDVYPLPLEVKGRDEVFVGRVRQMPGQPNSLDLWIVADNLRKGAATNAVQILELMLDKGFLA